MLAGQLHLPAHRVHRHVQAGEDLALAGLDLLDAHDIGVRVELHVVEDAHRRHHESGFGGELAPQRLDLLGEAVVAVGGVDERHEGVADLDLEVVDLEDIGDRLVLRRVAGVRGRRRGARGRGEAGLHVAVDLAGKPRRAAGKRQERQHRNAGEERDRAHHGGRHAERLRIVRELAPERLVGGAAHAGLRDEEAGGGRDDQRRHL